MFKMRRSISQKHLSPPQQYVTAPVTTGSLEQMHWEALPHPTYIPDLSPSDFHWFSLLKEALRGKRFRSNNEVKLFVQQWLDEQPQTFF